MVVVGVLFVLAGLAALVVAYGNVGYERDRRSRGVVVPGRVVGVGSIAPTGQGLWAPVVEFDDGTGTPRRFTQPSGTNRKPQTGRDVRVWFDPHRPEDRPVIHDDRVTRLAPVVIALVGLGLLTGGVLTLTHL